MHAFQVPTHNNLQSFALQYVFLTIMQGLFGSQLAGSVNPSPEPLIIVCPNIKHLTESIPGLSTSITAEDSKGFDIMVVN